MIVIWLWSEGKKFSSTLALGLLYEFKICIFSIYFSSRVYVCTVIQNWWKFDSFNWDDSWWWPLTIFEVNLETSDVIGYIWEFQCSKFPTARKVWTHSNRRIGWVNFLSLGDQFLVFFGRVLTRPITIVNSCYESRYIDKINQVKKHLAYYPE